MPLPQTIAEAEAKNEKERKKRQNINAELPQEMLLSKLVGWVQNVDPEFKGLSELELCVRVTGDPESGAELYKKARREGGESRDLRIFCLARQTRLLGQLENESSSMPQEARASLNDVSRVA